MNLWVETVLVGVYCALLSRFVNQPFIFGFVKHALGYVAGLHSWFCQVRNAGTVASVSWAKLGFESVFEGLGVAGLCIVLGRSAVAFFVVGCLLHLGSEIIGYHGEFLKRCGF